MKVNDNKIFDHFDIAIGPNCFPVAMGIYTETNPEDHMSLQGLEASEVYSILQGQGFQSVESTDKGFIIWIRNNGAHIAAIVDGEIQDFRGRSEHMNAVATIIMAEA